MKRAVALALVSSFAAGCLPAEVPPPAVPERLVPDVAPAPPEPNKGEVAIAADEPAVVEEVTGHFEGVGGDGTAVDGLTFAIVCPSTPCSVDLPRGPHQLRLTSLADPARSGTGSIEIADEPSAYRYALGHNVEPSTGRQVGGLFAVSYGSLGMIGGAILIGIGKTADTPNGLGGTDPGSNLRPLGLGMAFVSTVLFAYGWHLLRHTGGQAQAGTGVQWIPN